MVVVKFLVFVSEVVSIFSKILTWIIGGGQKDTFAPPTQLLGGACPGCPPKSTPMLSILDRIPVSSVPSATDAPVRNLGVTFDPHLSFSNHISNLSRSCFMHIRDLRRIRPVLDFKTASTIATSIVHTKLDYCNSLFINIDKTQINRFQAIQKHYHTTPVLNSLHWLKIPERLQYKVISLTYNTLQTSQPSYLRQLFNPLHFRP